MDRPPRNDTDNRCSSTRKAYSKPRLQIYGNLQEITQAVGKNGRTDGGVNPNQRNNTKA